MLEGTFKYTACRFFEESSTIKGHCSAIMLPRQIQERNQDLLNLLCFRQERISTLTACPGGTGARHTEQTFLLQQNGLFKSPNRFNLVEKQVHKNKMISTNVRSCIQVPGQGSLDLDGIVTGFNGPMVSLRFTILKLGPHKMCGRMARTPAREVAAMKGARVFHK